MPHPATSVVLSPSALTRHLGCEHRTYLDILKRRGELLATPKPPNLESLFERGARHESEVLQRFIDDGRDVAQLEYAKAESERHAARTLELMQAGVEIVHQGCFLRDGWLGYPDFLVRVDTPSAFGAWSYEVHDAKLSGHAKPEHLFQLLFYNEELTRLQELEPKRMHLLLGSGARAFKPAEFEAFAARVRQQFVARSHELEAPGADPAYPYKTTACDFCHWWHVCKQRRRDDDHVSLTATVYRSHGLKLEAAGIHTVVDLAAVGPTHAVKGVPRATLGKLQSQAALQVRSRTLTQPLYELLEPEYDRGLGRLPEPSAGDVCFDFEGDPNWGDDGLEYLFGTTYEDAGRLVYEPRWATSRAEERQAVEAWIDWLTARLARHPDLHVFHFNAYEVTALKKLVSRHSTREAELDDLLYRQVFVDLRGIVRQSVRAGVESYGLKALEALTGFKRNAEVSDALGSLRRWERYLEDHDPKHPREIGLYNRDDCLSTHELFLWLLERRPEAEARFEIELAALKPQEPHQPSPKALAHQARVEALRGPLLAGLPDDETDDTPEERARRIAFNLLSYHRREAKPAWWKLFDRRLRTIAELRDEDAEALADLEVLSSETTPRGTTIWTVRFPPQEHKVKLGPVDVPHARHSATLESLDTVNHTARIRCGKKLAGHVPRAIAPSGPLDTDTQQGALARFADTLVAGGLDLPGAALDVLLRRPPRLHAGTPSLNGDPTDLERIRAQVRGLDRSALVIQGPPGTGKTYTGGRIAVDLLDRGLSVGVMATSHNAINTLLRAIDGAADEAGVTFRGWKRSSKPEDRYESARVVCTTDRPSDDDGPIRLIGATAWYWTREDQRASVDVLLVDEAGQVSIGDAIAACGAATNVVLLGDPQQLAHVSQGTHPIGTGASVLQHLLGDADTIAPDRGILLPTTWRMHPSVCEFVSATMYDGRLAAIAGCEQQRVDSVGLNGSGLRLITVEHSDNRGRSREEAGVIKTEVDRLLAGGIYVDRDGRSRALTLEDILVVTPYNAQVRCLQDHLPQDARVGTVDKFQGQEAPVVIFSMATSSGEDASRGMGFLFSRNRLNVAVSRAQALAVVVCSPQLLTANCSSVEDMKLVNMLCRFADASTRACDLP